MARAALARQVPRGHELGHPVHVGARTVALQDDLVARPAAGTDGRVNGKPHAAVKTAVHAYMVYSLVYLSMGAASPFIVARFESRKESCGPLCRLGA